MKKSKNTLNKVKANLDKIASTPVDGMRKHIVQDERNLSSDNADFATGKCGREFFLTLLTNSNFHHSFAFMVDVQEKIEMVSIRQRKNS